MHSATALQIAVRRARVRQLRTKARVLPRMVLPSPLRYAAQLVAISQHYAELARKFLLPALASLAHEQEVERALRTDSASDDINDAFERLRVSLGGVDRNARAIAVNFAESTADANLRAMNAQLRTIVPVDVFHSNAHVEHVIDAAANRNVALIKSIPERMLEDLRKEVLPRVEAGVRSEAISAVIERRFGVSERVAGRIARTETNKLNAALTQTRNEDLGIESYTWCTAGDERVRGDPSGKYPNTNDNHYKLNGKVFRYDDPPVVNEETGSTANPGEDYECRCQALANVNDMLASLEALDNEESATDVFSTEPANDVFEEPQDVGVFEPPSISQAIHSEMTHDILVADGETGLAQLESALPEDFRAQAESWLTQWAQESTTERAAELVEALREPSWAQAVYAGTQAQLVSSAAAAVDADGLVTVYRGISGDAAEAARTARLNVGAQISAPVRAVSSWTTDREIAERFAVGARGVVIAQRVHPNQVFAVLSGSGLGLTPGGGPHAAEWIVLGAEQRSTLAAFKIKHREVGPYFEGRAKKQ